MCGIAGIINPKDGSAIRDMTRAILHRGPDDEGFFKGEDAALGMRRLSIIDLAGGHQPMSSTDGRHTIVFNGEIYNYKEIRKELTEYKFKTDSDTEVILAAYLKWGEGAFVRLRGMFAFCIHDAEEEKITLVRDFFGIKPLYYLQAGPVGPTGPACVSAFASEVKSFLALPGFKPEVNDEAVFNYLSYQYNPLPETFFKGVYKLPPAHYMAVNLKDGSSKVSRYWQFEFKEDENLGEEEAKRRVAETMRDSVTHHMIADVPVGSFLSGGIDSSIIATLMSRRLAELESGSRPQSASGQKVKTFTVTFGSVSEGAEAKETAEPLGTDHKEISVGSREYFAALPKVIWHFDEPVADPSALGLYFLAREARKEVKVVLSGEGADELFGGYNIYLEPFSRQKISWLPRPVLKLLASLPVRGRNYARRALESLEERYIGNATVFNHSEARKLWRGEAPQEFSLDSIYSEAKGLSDSTKMQYVDINTWLVGDILAKADKMTMAHSLELRVPFLDKEVAELARILPGRLKWRGRTSKYVLREAFKDMLPESTRTRRKLGFPIPIREWFTSESSDAYETILKNPYIAEKLDTSYIQGLIAGHVSGRADHSRRIYLLLMLAVWYDVFIRRHSQIRMDS